MNPATRTSDDKARIRTLIDAWAEATRNNDLDAIMAFHAPEVRTFDCHSMYQFKDAAAYRAFYEACLAHMQGKMTFDIDDLDIAVGGDIAVCHFLASCGATGLDGSMHLGRLRTTMCFRRMNGNWLIVHSHCSAPFDPRSGATMFGAEPAEAPQAGAA